MKSFSWKDCEKLAMIAVKHCPKISAGVSLIFVLKEVSENCWLIFFNSVFSRISWKDLFVIKSRFNYPQSQVRVLIFITWYKAGPAWTHALEGPHWVSKCLLTYLTINSYLNWKFMWQSSIHEIIGCTTQWVFLI